MGLFGLLKYAHRHRLVRSEAISTPPGVLTLIFASLPEMGFPCFYATVADYDTLNDTSGGVWTRQPLVAPALFLETPTVTSFFGFTATVLLAHALYAVAGAVVLRREAGAQAF